MTKPIVFMFSGQGSQYYLMGRQLYEQHPGFRRWMEQCDAAAAPMIQQNLSQLIYQPIDKNKEFDRLLYTNPALLCIQYSLTRVLLEMDIEPDYLIGYSLGEIAAAVVTGSLSLADGIRLSIDLAALLEQASPLAGMLAIFETPDIFSQFPELFANVWLTGRNFSKNFVVTGLAEDIAQLQRVLNQRKIICQSLPVKYAFHTPLLDPLQSQIQQLAQGIDFNDLNIPILSPVNGQWKVRMDAAELWRIIRQPVNFADSIQNLLNTGDYVFVDVGPSGTLAAFVKYSLPSCAQSLALQTLNRFGKDLESLQNLKLALGGAIA
jgi:acyl transferase domain-containing protein